MQSALSFWAYQENVNVNNKFLKGTELLQEFSYTFFCVTCNKQTRLVLVKSYLGSDLKPQILFSNLKRG